MTVLAVSGDEIALAAVAAVFVVFALIVSMVVPRSRPDFPGTGGVRAVVLASIVLFAATMTAMWVLVPSHGAHAAEGEHPETTEGHSTTPEEEEETETGEVEAEPEVVDTTEGPATTAPGESSDVVEVVGSEFELEPDRSEFAPGRYTFELVNEGEVGHDLVIEGPGIDDTRTPVIDGGETADIEAALESGTYKLYCSVPGHEDAGMVTEITVS